MCVSAGCLCVYACVQATPSVSVQAVLTCVRLCGSAGCPMGVRVVCTCVRVRVCSLFPVRV